MVTLELRHIRKFYDKEVRVVTDFNLTVADKEFIVFVGPSGCGKSTTLRMIAGLEEISEGEFLIDGKRMNDVVPKNRNIAMVFQHYALYPHMTVFDNMAFGLKMSIPASRASTDLSAFPVIPGISLIPAFFNASIAPCPLFPRISVETPRLFR